MTRVKTGGLRHLAGTAVLVICASFAAAALTVAATFLFAPQYRATARFSPESGGGSRLPLGLTELASQFSLDLGTQGLKPLQYYSVVLRSDAVVDRVLDSELHLSGDSLTLRQYLEQRLPHRDSLPREQARKWLRDRVAVAIDFRASTMELSATLPDRQLAAATANLFLDALNHFNTSMRASQARARREYLEGVLALQRDSLRRAEDSLQVFLEHNRLYKESPALDFQETRLRRRVDLDIQLVSTIQRDLEAARLDEINDTPVLSVIDSATPPLRRVSPTRLRTGAFAAVIIGAAALYAVVLGFGQPRPRRGMPLRAAVIAARLDRKRNQLLRRAFSKTRRRPRTG